MTNPGGTVGWKGADKSVLEFSHGNAGPAPSGRARLRYNSDTGTLQFSANGGSYADVTLPATSDTVIPVYTENDFPAPVGGVRQLAAGTLYFLQAQVDIGDSYLELGDLTVIAGLSPGPTKITNSHDEFLVRGTGGLRNVQLEATSPSAVAVSIDDNFGRGAMSIDTCSIINSSEAVRIEGCSTLSITRLFLRDNQMGLIVDGPVGRGQIESLQEVGSSLNPAYRGVLITDEAILGPFKISDCQFDLGVNGQAVFDFSGSAVYPSTELEIINNNITVSNGALPLTGDIEKTDPRFIFRRNTGIVDSVFVGSIGYDGNTTQQTTIPAQNTYVPIGNGNPSNPLLVLSSAAERFSLQGAQAQDQVLQYDGLETITSMIAVSCTLERAGGGTDIVRLRVTKNGIPVDGSDGSAESNALSSSITRVVPTVLSTGDQLQIQIANGTDNGNIRAVSTRLSASRIF